MNKHPDDIFTLMVEKLTGYISAEDDAWLDNLLATNAEAREKWAMVQQSFAKEQLDNIAWAPVETLTGRATKARKRRFSMAAIWIAAILLAGIATTWVILSRNHQPSQLAANNDAILGKSVQLRLANGKIISLNNRVDTTYSAGDVKLTGSSKSLSYAGSGQSAGINTLTVPIGLDYTIHLPDGSVVYLNSATVLAFPSRFTGNTRDITVNGEAYLQVAKDAAHPFVVHLPHGSVQVLGTEFNVNSYDSGVVKVALIKGMVKMQVAGRQQELQPGQEGYYNHDGLSVRPFDAERTLGWRNGIYYFDNASLRQVVRVLPRWFGMQVQMDNDDKAGERFTGRVYRNQPITDFLDNLKTTTTVNYYIKDSVVHFE